MDILDEKLAGTKPAALTPDDLMLDSDLELELDDDPPPAGARMARDGGSVFADPARPRSGLTFRDYFAAAALQGLLASYSDRVPPDPGYAARHAYACADAMLARREEPS